MPQTIFSIEPNVFYIYFLVLDLAGVILGVVLYRAMRNPKMHHMSPRTVFDFDEPPMSERCSFWAAVIVALLIMTYSYMDNWNHFYSVSQDTDGLAIHYLFPDRTKYIADVNKIKINTINEYRRGFRITIRDDGHTYSSQVMDRQQIIENATALETALKLRR